MVTLKKWTVEELLALDETGKLNPERRYELLDGEVYEMQPIHEGHAGGVDKYYELLYQTFQGRVQIRSQNPIYLDDFDLPQPDFALLRPDPDFYTKNHPRPEDIYLVMEVSDSTLAYDRGKKLKRYALAGICEVCIVNLKDNHTEVYRDPMGEEYLTRFVVKAGKDVTFIAFPNAPITLLG
jgi:Uma2 family endonuclease